MPASTQPFIPRTPTVQLISDPDGTPTKSDISCYVKRFAHEVTPEEIDVSTFCNTAATEVGKVSDSAVLTVLWSEEMYDELSLETGNIVGLEVMYNAGDTKAVSLRVRWAAIPFGTIEVGQINEVDIPLAVLVTPDYVVPSA